MYQWMLKSIQDMGYPCLKRDSCRLSCWAPLFRIILKFDYYLQQHTELQSIFSTHFQTLNRSHRKRFTQNIFSIRRKYIKHDIQIFRKSCTSLVILNIKKFFFRFTEAILERVWDPGTRVQSRTRTRGSDPGPNGSKKCQKWVKNCPFLTIF